MSYPKLTPIIAKGATEPRYLEDRFTDIVNVKDFGAKGNGETDDILAFQNAINAGNTVYVPEGTYVLSEDVNGSFFTFGNVVILEGTINGSSTLTSPIIVFDNVAAMINGASKLAVNTIIQTKGFYTAGDRGAAKYIIKEIFTDENEYSYGITNADGSFGIPITETLCAVLIIENNKVSFSQLGARCEQETGYEHEDCKVYLQRYINYLQRSDNRLQSGRVELLIPAGIWCFSATHLQRDRGFSIIGQENFARLTMSGIEGTVIAPVEDNQDYVWKFGGKEDYTDNTHVNTNGIVVKNLVFTGAVFSADSEIESITRTMYGFLILDECGFVLTDSLFFQDLKGRALTIRYSYECYWPLLNFRRILDIYEQDENGIAASVGCMAFKKKTGVSGMDSSAHTFGDMMFERVNGTHILCDTGCSFCHSHINSINIEYYPYYSDATQEGWTKEDIDSTAIAYNFNYTIFQLKHIYEVKIEDISLFNFTRFYGVDASSNKIITDKLFTIPAPTELAPLGGVQVYVDTINFFGSKVAPIVLYNTAYGTADSNRTVLSVNRIHMDMQSNIIELSPPRFNLTYFNKLDIGEIITQGYQYAPLLDQVMAVGRYPCYKFPCPGAYGKICSNVGASGTKIEGLVEPTGLALCHNWNENARQIMRIWPRNGYKLRIRIKIPTSITNNIGLQFTRASDNQLVSVNMFSSAVTGTGKFEWYEQDTPIATADESKPLTIYDVVTLDDPTHATAIWDSFEWVYVPQE